MNSNRRLFALWLEQLGFGVWTKMNTDCSIEKGMLSANLTAMPPFNLN